MKIVNKAVKALAAFAVHVYVAFLCYVLSFCFTSPIISFVLVIVSAVMKRLPELIIRRYIFVCLVSSIPLWFLFYGYIIWKNRNIKK